MELRVRPTVDYMHHADWSELYHLAKHWQSDMEFYRDELQFLRGLIDKYFIWLINDENIALIQAISGKLIKSGKQQEEISDKIQKHIQQLQELVDGALSDSTNQFRKAHAELEDDFTDFVKSFREVKRQVFATTEHVIAEEKLQRLLTS